MEILICDYDGTLKRHNFNILKRNITFYRNLKNIKKFKRKGNIFILSTGRYFDSINKEILRHNIPFDYLSCNDGAEIYDSEYSVIRETELSKKDLEYLNKNFKGRIKYCYNKSKNKIIAVKYNTFSIEESNNLYNKIKNNIKFSNITVKPNKVKIYPKEVNKADIFKYIKIDKNKIYSIGDDLNDKDLLENCNGYTFKESISLYNNVKIINSVHELIKKILKER